MAIASTVLIASTPNMLRYLVTSDGAGGGVATIPNAGGATPDLETDSLAGSPIRALIAQAAADQAAARAAMSAGNAALSSQSRLAAGTNGADANAAAGKITVEVSVGAASSSVYVTIEHRHSITQ